MKNRTKKILIVLSVLAILVGIGHIAVNSLLDPDKYLATMAGVLKDATGLDLKTKSGASIRLLPMPSITVSGVSLSGPEGLIAQVDGIRARIRLRPLFNKELLVSELRLDNPVFTLVRNEKGNLNITASSGKKKSEEKSKKNEKLALATVAVEKVMIRKGHFTYQDHKSKFNMETENITADAGPLMVISNNRLVLNSLTRWLREAPISGKLNVAQTKIRKRHIEDIAFSFTNENGIIRTEDLSYRQAGAVGSGKAVWDTLAPEPFIDAVTEIAGMDLASLSKNLYDGEETVTGRASFVSELHFQWTKAKNRWRGLSGEFTMVSDGMSLTDVDLEDLLDTFEKSRIDIVEIGEYMVFGLFEPVLTGSFSQVMASHREGQSEIRQLHSQWKIQKGIARTADVAFATRKYRVAMQGQIDLVGRVFKDFTIAVVDKNGCKRFGQTVSGSMDGSKKNVATFVVDTVTHPVASFIKKGIGMIFDCDVFYAGKVAHPVSAEY